MDISCRNCGQIKPRYEGTSWCVSCVMNELAVQEIERTAPEYPDVYDAFIDGPFNGVAV